MDLAKVIGTVVATRKDPSLEGTRLLIVQPLDEKQNPISDPTVAVDTLHDAGVGGNSLHRHRRRCHEHYPRQTAAS